MQPREAQRLSPAANDWPMAPGGQSPSKVADIGPHISKQLVWLRLDAGAPPSAEDQPPATGPATPPVSSLAGRLCSQHARLAAMPAMAGLAHPLSMPWALASTPCRPPQSCARGSPALIADPSDAPDLCSCTDVHPLVCAVPTACSFAGPWPAVLVPIVAVQRQLVLRPTRLLDSALALAGPGGLEEARAGPGAGAAWGGAP